MTVTDLCNKDGKRPDIGRGRVAAGDSGLGGEPAQWDQFTAELAVVPGVDTARRRHARQLHRQRASDEEVTGSDVCVNDLF